MNPLPVSHRRWVALIGGPGVLAGVAQDLRRRRIGVHRLVLFRPVPEREVAPPPPPDPGARRHLLLVTSETTAEVYLARSPKAWTSWKDHAEAWAAGPVTAHRLQELGFRRVRTAKEPGAHALCQAVGSVRGAQVLLPRSAETDPSLGTWLRRHGARVDERIVYRLRASTRLSRTSRDALRRADCLVATSPSALRFLRRILGPRSWQKFAREKVWVVLGPRSGRAARRLGVRDVRVAPSLSEKAFTAFLVDHVLDGPK